MDILTAIASWTGWLGVAALLLLVGGIGVWIYVQRIDFYQEELQDLQEKLKESQDNSPDILVKRLKDRLNLLVEELNFAEQIETKNNQRIHELEAELSSIKADVETHITEYNATVSELNELLKDKMEPRGGKVREDVFYAITSTIRTQGVIYIPIINSTQIDDSFIELVKKTTPYKLQVVFPGMMKMLFLVHNNRDDRIGQVHCPDIGVYYKDYCETLSKVLASVPKVIILGDLGVGLTKPGLSLQQNFITYPQ